jgi:G3E family GTPase
MRTKIYLINGKLGSGKTTILEQLLATPRFSRSSVIENEIANQDFDGHKITSSFADSDIAKISGECICCSDPENLINIALDLRSKKPSSAIIIESTGVASALQLVTKLISSDSFEENFEIRQLIYVVDAFSLYEGGLSKVDLDLADAVIVTKADLVNDAHRKVQLYITNNTVLTKRNREDVDYIANIPTNSSYKERIVEAIKNGSVQKSHDPFTKTIRLPRGCIIDPSQLHERQRRFGIDRIKGLILDKTGELLQYDATNHHFDIKIASWNAEPYLVIISSNVHSLKELQKWLKNQY